MFHTFLNWRNLLAVVAILIVSGTISYSSYLAKKIEKEEKQKVEEWVEASNSLLSATNTGNINLAFKIIQHNDDIPIIVTNEKDSILDYKNVDSLKIARQKNFLYRSLKKYKAQNNPVVWTDPLDSTHINRYYYGHSRLLEEVRYYPLVQLLVVSLFIAVTILALQGGYRSTQNRVWAGMAKETAHQLGTPVSSLEGWIEILKETPGVEKYIPELEKDITRLRLVSDRFSKIGSTPKLEERNVIKQIQEVMEYVRKRASGKVSFSINTHGLEHLPVLISASLFDWVMENLMKNALDAMEGKGQIQIDIQNQEKNVVIDVSDTGKGISPQNIGKVFKPGFTTKKRGWGLGLSLSKRIIEQYHKGNIYVKSSELGKGTTFRIVLKK